MPHLSPQDPDYQLAVQAVQAATQVAFEELSLSLSAISLQFRPIMSELSPLLPPSVEPAQSLHSSSSSASADSKSSGPAPPRPLGHDPVSTPGGTGKAGGASRSPALGVSCVRQGKRAWNLKDTRAMIGHSHPNLPGDQDWVGYVIRTGNCYHHLTCPHLYCKHGELSGRAFHKGTRVCTLAAAAATSLTQGKCCASLSHHVVIPPATK
jgi:hypothetical protein